MKGSYVVPDMRRIKGNLKYLTEENGKEDRKQVLES
jgi:hypothetical protein